jgi:hypothetical protein
VEISLTNAFVDNYKKYGADPNTHDILKYLALTTMFIDHIGLYLLEDGAGVATWLRSIGRWSFPIWAFLAGYAKPSRFDVKLLVLGILMVLFDFAMGLSVFPFNILFTIIACRLFISYLSKKGDKSKNIFAIFAILFIWSFVSFFFIEYGTISLMFAYCGYMKRYYEKEKVTDIAFLVTSVIYSVIQIYIFNTHVYQSFIIIIGVFSIMNYLENMKMRTFYNVKPNILNKFAMMLSRNSLFVYFSHCILLIYIEECLLK